MIYWQWFLKYLKVSKVQFTMFQAGKEVSVWFPCKNYSPEAHLFPLKRKCYLQLSGPSNWDLHKLRGTGCNASTVAEKRKNMKLLEEEKRYNYET